MDMGQPILPSHNGNGKELGERIRRARAEAGLSQAEFGRRLAESIGRRRPLSQAAISDMERGDAPVSIDLIPKIAAILEKGLSYFSPAQAPTREAFNKLTNANYTLEKWKEAAHLKTDFPQLRLLKDHELDEEQQLYLGEDHRRLVEEIQDRAGLVGGSDPLIVQVSRGQGCTTLSRYVSTQMSRRFRQSRAIPIRLELHRMGGPGGVAAVAGYVEERIRSGIVEHLLSLSWLRGRAEYGRCQGLLRAMSHMSESDDGEHSKHYKVLSDQLADAADFISATNGNMTAANVWSRLLDEKLDHLRNSFVEYLSHLPLQNWFAELARHPIITISLQLDCSSELAYMDSVRYEALLAEATKVIHSFQERDAKHHTSSRPLVVNELYFMDRDAFEFIESMRPKTYANAEIVEYPWYRAADVLGMLAHQYLEPDHQRPRAETLMSLVDPKLFEGIVGPRIPLVETVRLLERRLIRIAAAWDQAPGQLSITAMAARTTNVSHAEVLRPSVTLMGSAGSRTSSA